MVGGINVEVWSGYLDRSLEWLDYVDHIPKNASCRLGADHFLDRLGETPYQQNRDTAATVSIGLDGGQTIFPISHQQVVQFSFFDQLRGQTRSIEQSPCITW